MNEGASVGSRATQKNVQKFETSGMTKIVTHKQYLWNSATDGIWMEEREHKEGRRTYTKQMHNLYSCQYL